MFFIPRQYSWDHRHEHERRKKYAASLPNKLKKQGPTHAFQIFFPKLLQNSLHNL